MCTSTGVKPARAKAAAISTSPLTPCSRRMATLGWARFFFTKGAATSSFRSKPSFTCRPGFFFAVSPLNSSLAQSGLSRRACMR